MVRLVYGATLNLPWVRVTLNLIYGVEKQVIGRELKWCAPLPPAQFGKVQRRTLIASPVVGVRSLSGT